jgi:hypothetical protein
MRKPLCFAIAALASATLVAPVRAQNFLTGSVYPIPSGDLRMIGAPTQMFGRDGRPDRTGAAFRMGYGLSDALGVDAKAAFFEGVTLVGGDGHFRLLDGDTTLSLGLGGHQAIVSAGPDSTALDLSAEARTRLGAGLDVYAGTSVSFEFANGPVSNDFTRVYLVPGLRCAVARHLDLLLEGGIGLNHESPHYLTVGVAWRVPVSDKARVRDR